ncbi:MAG: M1 family metallopeptidase [Saprospiraceae bacterium]|nr:M1 family metallopeptidase [Saprospiraceae bacterium]
MMPKKIISGFFCLFLSIGVVLAQNHLPRFEQIDVLHYIFQLELSDENDIIKGKANVTIHFLKDSDAFALDLASKTSTNAGMEVSTVLENGQAVSFRQADDQLIIEPLDQALKGSTRNYTIAYEGEPQDGLIIAKNKFGDRTFFGDNWPDRAHYWLPTVDHPSDKATVEFIVIAPEHYQVVANGEQFEETNLEDGTKLTHWKEAVPLPTKVMVIGVARFAVQLAGYSHDTPVTSWIYPQDREAGFDDYSLAVRVLDYYTEKIGAYPYEKLANVQSKTRYGGMENAGNIFYYEGSVTGKKDHEALIAHEIVHQWFGNSASELSWHHVWLSEGFATYLTDLYFEDLEGAAVFTERMQSERNQVIRYARQNPVPIVNTEIEDYNELLNPNSYQKGGWVLHMLRHKLGKEIFWKGIRMYYDKYKFSNALTSDFQAAMEEASGQDLEAFFRQWIFRAGHPVLKDSWKQKNGTLEIAIIQTQEGAPFFFPLEVEITFEDGTTTVTSFQVDTATESFELPARNKVTGIRLDPGCKLLFEED